MKIKKGDQVLIISGKDRGQKGKVLEVFTVAERVTVEGLNLAKKHRKARRQNEKGQIVSVPRPLHVSNVKLICPKCGQPARLGYKQMATEKLRLCKKCQQEI
ncbi:MAG: 50S ribosomal protein L24 [Patescibacteria group bacterium]